MLYACLCFVKAIREFQGEREVRDMLTILLEKCFHVYSSDEETSDNKMSSLPSFLQSLANIIRHADIVSCLKNAINYLMTLMLCAQYWVPYRLERKVGSIATLRSLRDEAELFLD